MTTPSIYRTRTQFKAAVESLQRAVTFKAWRLRDGPTAYPIELPPCDTIEDAVAAAKPSLGHKDRLFILEDGAGCGEAFQHGWTVRRKSAPRYVRGDDGLTKPVHDLDLYDHFALAVAAFEPVRPFDAFRDDASGRDLSLVEAR